MIPDLLETIRLTQEAVSRLVEACRKQSPLYRQHPQTVAQINRTAKWLLSAIAGLNKKLATPPSSEESE
jgi:hypothetical protein